MRYALYLREKMLYAFFFLKMSYLQMDLKSYNQKNL